jgi:hypothetical protein
LNKALKFGGKHTGASFMQGTKRLIPAKALALCCQGMKYTRRHTSEGKDGCKEQRPEQQHGPRLG